jgi:naphthoate synthase
VTGPFNPDLWDAVPGFAFSDISYHRAVDAGVVRIAFDRPQVRNAFRPHTVDELYRALDHARMSADVGVVLLTGNGPSPKDAAGPSAAAATSGSGPCRMQYAEAREPTP